MKESEIAFRLAVANKILYRKLGERINNAKSRGGVCYLTVGCLGLIVSYNLGLARFTGLARFMPCFLIKFALW